VHGIIALPLFYTMKSMQKKTINCVRVTLICVRAGFGLSRVIL